MIMMPKPLKASVLQWGSSTYHITSHIRLISLMKLAVGKRNITA